MPLSRLFFCLLSALLLPALTGAAVAGEEKTEQVRQSIELLLPGVQPDSIRATPIAGLFEVVIGTRITYISGDGRYLIEGNIIDLERRLNITEPRLMQARLDVVRRIGRANMLLFSPQEVKYRVMVFTDIDSGFGRKMQREVADYTNLGIELRYLLFPRAGINSASYRKAVSIWCADDRKEALTAAAKGEAVAEKTCDNPVKQHFAVGEMIGVTGTPVLLLESGEMIPAYVPAEELAAILKKSAQH